ncbi:MAG: hypothetical protein ABIR65_01225 [Pseudolysinimonas sp.]
MTIDWPAIHRAARAVDAVRGGRRRVKFGYDGTVDAFGGSYRAHNYAGLAGLVTLSESAATIARHVWDHIRGASDAIARRSVERRPELVDDVRVAVRTALALHEMHIELARTGIIEYAPASQICGVTETLQVTGLLWLAGRPREDCRVSAARAREFAAGAELAVLLLDTHEDTVQGRE